MSEPETVVDDGTPYPHGVVFTDEDVDATEPDELLPEFCHE